MKPETEEKLADRPRRKAVRRDLTYQVWIAYGDERRVVPCTISNISETGACLCLPFNGDVPDEFVLMLSRRARRKCTVVWRSTLELGVRFEA
jgi:hypothetical protein